MRQQMAMWQKKCHISNFRNINDTLTFFIYIFLYIYTQSSFKFFIVFVELDVSPINLKVD
jgi:hypothetical protein